MICVLHKQLTLMALTASAIISLTVCAQTASTADAGVPVSALSRSPQIGSTIANSTPGQLGAATAPGGAPNVVVVLLDDVGFGATGTLGGMIPTPTLDHLAAGGLLYNRFHTTGICSPTRAALLTGRNHHSVGMGELADMPSAYPGYTTAIPASAATVAEVLRQHGYATSAWGKWHLTPIWERSPSGPFNHWPTGMGFEKYYGVLSGESNEYEPRLFDGTTPVARPDTSDYHLTEDLAAHAIAWMREQKSVAPNKPFFVYFAPAATHAPLHVPAQWIAPFRGKFDQGWDAVREQIFARQKQLGVIPATAKLTSRPAQIPAWENLSPELRRFSAETMEVYAGYMAHTDAQIGRLVAALVSMGQFDNTLFVYVVGDNGASAEAGIYGSANNVIHYNGLEENIAQLQAKEAPRLGGPDTNPGYAAGWAWAMDTPFQWTKQVASHLGGIRNPLVVTWPQRIHHGGELRSQFYSVIDVVPTIYAAAGIVPPQQVNGVAQQPIEGESMLASFADAKVPGRSEQYFEIGGTRSVYKDGWMASAFHGRVPWQSITPAGLDFAKDRWELYNLDADFSQADDLAEKFPDKLQALQAQFWIDAGRFNIAPLDDRFVNRPRAVPAQFAINTSTNASTFTYLGPVSVDQSAAPRFLNRSYRIDVDIDVPAAGAHGVLMAMGGREGGFSLYLDAEGRVTYVYNNLRRDFTRIAAGQALAAGRHAVTLDVRADAGGVGQPADVVLSVDGKTVGKARLASTVPYLFTVTEGFDVGTDSQSPVADYPRDYRFSGEIRSARVSLQP